MLRRWWKSPGGEQAGGTHRCPRIRRFTARNLLSFPVRLAGFLALVVLVGGVNPGWTGQFLLASALTLGFLISYRIFVLDLVRYPVEHPGQASILVLLLAMLDGQGLGLGRASRKSSGRSTGSPGRSRPWP